MNEIFSKIRNWISTSQLGVKLLLPSLFIFLFVLILFFAYNTVTFNTENQARQEASRQRSEQILGAELQKLSDFALGLAIQSAQTPQIQEAFVARNRLMLLEMTRDTFNGLRDQFGVRQYHFHTPESRSFLRVNVPDSFGDDLSGFRATVVLVNATLEPVAGLEVGRTGLGLRGVHPVFYEAEHIGSVEFGLNIDAVFVENLNARYENDWRILITKESVRAATRDQIFADLVIFRDSPIPELFLLGETIPEPYQSEETYFKVLEGETVTTQIRGEQNRTYLVTSLPLRDYQGQVIGVVESITDNTAIVQAQTNRFLLLLVGLLMVAAAGGFAMVSITNRSLSPLQGLTEAALAIEKGDFTRQVPVTSSDEIGLLATTFNSMTNQLHTVFGSLEQRVADRTKALETSFEVSRRLSTILDQATLAREVVEQVQSAFNYYHAHIYFFDDQNENLVMAGGTGEAGIAMLASEHKIPKGRGLVGRAAESNEPVLVPDVSQSIGWLPNPLLPDTKAEAAVPISAGGQVMGVLDVQHNIVNGLGEDDVTLLQSLAGQIAISLQNARAYGQSRAQAELESMVNIIGQKIQRAGTVEETLQIAIREVGVALGAARVRAKIGLDTDTAPTDTNPAEEASQN
ncbi:MAG: cache domain-containing protein [Anaerolineales bacterium]